MSDLTLPHLQEWMQKALVWSGTQTDPKEISDTILPSSRLAPVQRLGIYQRGYYARLLQCMEGQYKALCQALGVELFRDFAREYLRDFPSASPTLSELGARFPQWLSENRPDKEEPEAWIDFMIELAKYEWTLYLFFDKQGHEGFPLATADTAEKDLVPQRSLELHSYTFPVAAFYHVIADGGDPPVPEPSTSYYAILRTNYKTLIFHLTQPQQEFLMMLAEGISIHTALEKLAAQYSKSAEEISVLWKDWKDKWLHAGFFEIHAHSATPQG